MISRLSNFPSRMTKTNAEPRAGYRELRLRPTDRPTDRTKPSARLFFSIPPDLFSFGKR